MAVYGKENGKKIFNVPVEWTVSELLQIRADSFKEAIQFVLDNLDMIPLGTEPDYIDGTYKISSEYDEAEEIEEELSMYYGNKGSVATELDIVERLEE